MPRTGFYEVTRNALDRVTDTYDFLWPTTAALWNFRWQVRGYIEAVPDATEDELRARFMHANGAGSNYRNFRGGFANVGWEAHVERLGGVLLINLVGIYEAWCKAIVVAATGSPKKGEKYEKQLQFPTATSAPTKGVLHVVRECTTHRSAAMTAAFHPVLSAHTRYSWNRINDLLVCFRYFKEIRNCLAHNGSLASATLVQAAADYSPVAGNNFPMAHPPPCRQYLAGDPVAVDLRAVVAFGEALLRTMVSIDAELAVTKNAETAALAAWSGRYRQGLTYPADRDRRRARVAREMMHVGFPRPLPTDDLPHLMQEHGLIRY